MKPDIPSSLCSTLHGLRICARVRIPQSRRLAHPATPTISRGTPANARAFCTTQPLAGNWLEPNIDRNKKMKKGKPKCRTGGSVKGTTVVWGDYGLRMRDHDRRISAQHLKLAEDAVKVRLRGQKYRLYKRVCCNVGVYTKGNDLRMGKGKGSFDYWATRMSVNQIVFELRGMIHEKVARDAFRVAGNKLPGEWDFAKKGEAPMVGLTSLKNTTMKELKKPRKPISPAHLAAAAPTATMTEEGSAGVAASTSP